MNEFVQFFSNNAFAVFIGIALTILFGLFSVFVWLYGNHEKRSERKGAHKESQKAHLSLVLKKLQARVRYIDYELIITNAGPAAARNLCVTINDNPIDQYALAQPVELSGVVLAKDATYSLRFSAHQDQTLNINEKQTVDNSRHELPKKGKVIWVDDSGAGECETSF